MKKKRENIHLKYSLTSHVPSVHQFHRWARSSTVFSAHATCLSVPHGHASCPIKWHKHAYQCQHRVSCSPTRDQAFISATDTQQPFLFTWGHLKATCIQLLDLSWLWSPRSGFRQRRCWSKAGLARLSCLDKAVYEFKEHVFMCV